MLFRWIRLFAVVLTLVVLPTNRVSAGDDLAAVRQRLTAPVGGVEAYESYRRRYSEVSPASSVVVIPAARFVESEDAEVEILGELEGRSEVLYWKSESGTVTWRVAIGETGLYQLYLSYYPRSARNREVDLGLLIDGKAPFAEAERCTFPKAWRDAGSITRDSRGNELRPRQVEYPVWITAPFSDIGGAYNEPFAFYLAAGDHLITLVASRADFAIETLQLRYAPAPEPYEVVHRRQVARYGTDDPIRGVRVKIQGEHAGVRSDPTLAAVFDRTDPSTEPSHPTQVRYNAMGGKNWRYAGQWISWDFEVPRTGFYKIGFKSMQDFKRGLFTTRRLTIDGETPFLEAEEVRFPFNRRWYLNVPGDKAPYYFHLEKGPHRLALEVVPGETAESLRVLSEAVFRLNYLYLMILMITGPTPDPYRDYYLERQIPTLLDGFRELDKVLAQERARLERITGQTGSEAEILNRLSIQLRGFVREPETIPARLENYKSNISALSAWMLGLREQPLTIDYIEILSPDEEFQNPRAGFMRRFAFGVRQLIGSYTHDYSAIGNVYEGDDVLTVWVGLGRDQVQLVKEMVDDLFVTEYGVGVNVNLVQQGLIQATLAGKGPDIALMVPHNLPINLAVRGALADLSRFDGFDEVTRRFQRSAMVPYEYRGGYYGLPVTQQFSMMFYRKDILDALGVEPPDTWDDFYRIIPIIQQSNMTIGIPNMVIDVSRTDQGVLGYPSNTAFQILLYQNGGRYFNDDRSKTAFDTPQALDAFRRWTGFFSSYSFPISYNFYSRFRTGEMPVALEPYQAYNQLVVGAPEIRNLWRMAPIPGTRREDGSINRANHGGGSGAVMFRKAKNKEAAWEFLRWFTSADVQVRFGRSLEALIGPAARYNTANMEALRGLPWSEREYRLLMEQWREVVEVPQIPASYYVHRNLYNAFRRVTFYYENSREVLALYNREINEEIARKRIEFGIESNVAASVSDE